MSRNLYDSSNDTLTPIGGYQSVDSALSTTSGNPLMNRVVTSEFNKTYKSDDAVETTIGNEDYIPFYDTSAQLMKKISKANADFGGGMLPHLIIISDTGSTVTVTKGTTVIAAPETSTGHFECDIPEFGTWTIDAVLSGDDAQMSLVVDTVKVYTVDDSHWHASITVTFPSGATCRCYGGDENYYTTTTPYTFTVHSANTYTVTATDGTSTDSDTVTITTSGQSESVRLTFVPDGSTVVPTDNIQTWLHCGDIWDKSYTTIAGVLTDSTTLLALISDANASAYMARSTTWAATVTADQTAMTYIGANDDCADALLANSTWLDAIANSAYVDSVFNVKVPTMTSNTTPSGECIASGTSSGQPWQCFRNTYTTSDDGRYWQSNSTQNAWIGYKFPNRILLVAYIQRRIYISGPSTRDMNTVNIQASNDGINWTDLATNVTINNNEANEKTLVTIHNNSTKYQYYRIYELTGSSAGVLLTQVQFYGRA